MKATNNEPSTEKQQTNKINKETTIQENEQKSKPE